MMCCLFFVYCRDMQLGSFPSKELSQASQQSSRKRRYGQLRFVSSWLWISRYFYAISRDVFCKSNRVYIRNSFHIELHFGYQCSSFMWLPRLLIVLLFVQTVVTVLNIVSADSSRFIRWPLVFGFVQLQILISFVIFWQVAPYERPALSKAYLFPECKQCSIHFQLSLKASVVITVLHVALSWTWHISADQSPFVCLSHSVTQ